MKLPARYLVFAGDDYEAAGGSADLVGTADTIDDAKTVDARGDWAEILDTQTGHVLRRRGDYDWEPVHCYGEFPDWRTATERRALCGFVLTERAPGGSWSPWRASAEPPDGWRISCPGCLAALKAEVVADPE